MDSQRTMQRIFTVAGVVLWIVVGLYYLDIRDVLDNGVRVTGQVVELEMRKAEGSTKRSFHPVVVFATADGRSVRFIGEVGSRPPAYEIGEEIGVLYHSSNPEEEVYIDSWMGLYFLPLVLGILGTVSIAIAIGTWIASRRARSE